MIRKILTTLKPSLFVTACLLTSGAANAQTITLFRSGVIVLPRYSTVETAIAAAMPGDSLVLSPHTYKEHNLNISKTLKLTGTSDASGMSTIDAEKADRAILINSGDVTLMDLAIKNGSINNSAGGGVCNLGTGSLTFAGYCTVSGCSATGIYANGGGIYSAGKLEIGGTSVISDNYAEESGGGAYAYKAVAIVGNARLTKNKTAGSGGGLFSVANGAVLLTDSASIDNNIADVAGGGMYGVGSIMRHGSIVNNKAEFGGGIAAFNDALFLYDTCRISNNTAITSGGGIWLNNCNLFGYESFQITGNEIPAVTGTLNFGGAIYNVNGNMNISGGKITGNHSPIATIYSSAGSKPNVIILNNCHLYNPRPDGTRLPEVYNSPALPSSSLAFTSTSCWWGHNDTTGIVVNRAGTFSGTINTYARLTWYLNNGSPVLPSMSTFPLTAGFMLNDGTKVDSTLLRTISGTFMATKGSFTPAMSMIDTSNFVRSMFRAPATDDSTMITAIIDGDTFRTGKLAVTGLSIRENNISQSVKVYPNPASETLFIADAPIGSSLILFSMEGKAVLQQTAANKTEQMNMSNLPAGIYLLQITDLSGARSSAQILKK